MIQIKKKSFSETFSVYFDKRMFKILLLGAISGFPWLLIGSSLSLWLKEDGLSRTTVGWAGLIFAVYAFNYLWAPLVDRIQIPYLTKKIGHRRGWIVLMQIFILISLILWSMIDPSENLTFVILVGLIIAIASATQDITVDALRIEQIGENESSSMAAGAAMAVVGWWSGYKLGGVLSLFSADFLEKIGFENTANIFSISNSSKNGGLIGWINELQLSSKVRNEINKLEIGQVSKPIKIQNGYLLIKINDKKEFKENINIEDQLTKLANKEKNRQLNTFSNIFYKRLKKNIKINEY